MPMHRRTFLQLSTLAAGGFLLGFQLEDSFAGDARDAAGSFKPNAWLRIESSGAVVFILDKTEMGQGVYTALPVILAEELEFNPELLRIEMAPADRVYVNSQLGGIQMTGGSTSVASTYQILRQAGATARTLLVEAAAKRWGVAPQSCRASDGRVYHPQNALSLSYAELAQDASRLKVPDEVPLKSSQEFKLIGKSYRRLDSRLKVSGEAAYGIDVKLPELRVAIYLRSPVLHATIKRWDGTKAKASLGVEDVVQMGEGIVIVAQRYWQARKAAELLEVEWEGGATDLSSAGIFAAFAEAARPTIEGLSREHSFPKEPGGALKTVEADYEVPYAAHAAMEPINCTVRITDRLCEIWAPTQAPGLAQQIAHELTGLPLEQVKVHTTFLGGGFGRRLYQDYVTQAVSIALLVKKPIKLLWSREEDFQHDFLRPATFHGVRAALDEKGRCRTWLHAIAGPSILSETLPSWVPTILPTWLPNFMKRGAGSALGSVVRTLEKDPTSVEGAADMPYDIPELEVQFERVDPGIPIGFWRSVGHSYTGFVVETMIDELAQKAGQDPVSFRLDLLGKAPRHAAVLRELATRSGWGQPTAAGLFRGLALHASFGSICGQVVEVRVDGSTIKVERVISVVDCGQVINPQIAEAQIAGGIVFGLSAALYGDLTVEKGAVKQSNFHDHPVLRYDQCPRIEVSFMQNQEKPTGLGEPGVPPLAPALANAVFAATGKRLRSLPLKL